MQKDNQPMNGSIHPDELLMFFKAMADANRLKILGLLAQENLSVEQLAGLLNLSSSTVSHHLAILSEAGLVSARANSYYNIYRLEPKALENIAQHLLAKETLPNIAAEVDMDAYDRKVLEDYSLPDGRLKNIPAQRKKLDVILRYLARSFEPGVHYSEKEINTILARYHQDTATLRRELVSMGLLKRSASGAEYWLAESPVD
jgi:predicted transcriptional regulator